MTQFYSVLALILAVFYFCFPADGKNAGDAPADFKQMLKGFTCDWEDRFGHTTTEVLQVQSKGCEGNKAQLVVGRVKCTSAIGELHLDNVVCTKAQATSAKDCALAARVPAKDRDGLFNVEIVDLAEAAQTPTSARSATPARGAQ